MIAFLTGSVFKIEPDRIILMVNKVGYEVMLPGFVMEKIVQSDCSDEVSLYIYYHQTERSPAPILIGFNTEEEKSFFKLFISVADIGPLKAVKAMTHPISHIASAIEEKDIALLKNLKGIGPRTAQKIVAQLSGKVSQFAVSPESRPPSTDRDLEMIEQVVVVLTEQLGYKPVEARQMINDAFLRNERISSAETLFDEIFTGNKNK